MGPCGVWRGSAVDGVVVGGVSSWREQRRRGGSSSCDSDEVRARPTGLPRACYPVCESQADCTGGATCEEVNSGNDLACVPGEGGNNPVGCTSNADCSGDSPVCSPAGVCVSGEDPCNLIDCQEGFTCVGGECVEVSTNNPVGCTSDAQCDAGEVCEAGTCIEDGGNECNFNSDCGPGELCQDGDCVRDPNVECVSDRDCSGVGEVCQNSQCIVPVDPAEQACVSYCQNIFGSCPKNTCTGLDSTARSNLDASFDACLNGGTAQDGSVINPCSQDYLRDPQFAAQVDQFAAEQCGSETLRDVYCGQFGFGSACNCTEPNVGAACNDDSNCEGGTLNAICIAEIDENGDETGFPGGICISGPCDAGSTEAGAGAIGAQTGCGENGFCLNEQGQQGVQSICYRACSFNSDCRSGYACEVVGFFTNGDPAGRCQPACSSNADCPVYTLNADPNTQLNSFCNADGWCEVPCNPNEADSCGSSGQQTCTTRSNFNTTTDFTGSCSL